jgi:DNA polymerase-1
MNWAYHGNRQASPTLLVEILQLSKGEVGVDIETVSLEDRTPIGIAFAPNPEEAFYFPMESPALPWHILTDTRVTKIFHNGHFDVNILNAYKGIKVSNIQDTIIAGNVLGLPNSLRELSLALFNSLPPEWKTIDSLLDTYKVKSMLDLPVAEVATKCCFDARYAIKCWLKLKNKIPQKAYTNEMALMPVLANIEQRGMRIDVDRLLAHKVEIETRLEHFNIIGESWGVNFGSNLDVADALMDEGYTVQHKIATGNPVLSKETLEQKYPNEPIAILTRDYRNTRSLLTHNIRPILNKFLKGDRIYPEILQVIASTGRLARRKPNTQNIPVSMRDIFIASKGCYLDDRDLSQIELRVLAYLVWQATGDKSMQAIFEAGGDIHAGTVQKIDAVSPNILKGDAKEKRKTAKTLNFGLVYGGDAETLAKQGIPIDMAKELIKTYYQAFPGVKLYKELVWQSLEINGYVETMNGKRRLLPDIHHPSKKLREAAKREGFNGVIQGTAGDIIKEIMVRMALEPQNNSVHDEIVCEPELGTTIRRDYSQNIAPFPTPMEIKYGSNWKNVVPVGTS